MLPDEFNHHGRLQKVKWPEAKPSPLSVKIEFTEAMKDPVTQDTGSNFE